MNLSDTLLSWIRTMVPLWIGVGLTWLALRFGIVVDEQTTAAVGALAVGVVTAVYYTVARRLEKRWPKLGWLLGSSKTPVYADAGQSVKVDGATRR